MKKRFSLVLLLGLLLALLAEAILTLLQTLQGGRIRFRWMRRSWIALPPPAAPTALLLAQRTNSGVEMIPAAARSARCPSHSHLMTLLPHFLPLTGSQRPLGQPVDRLDGES